MDNTNDPNSSNDLNPSVPKQPFNAPPIPTAPSAPLPDFASGTTTQNPSAPAIPDLSSVWTPPATSNPLQENVQQVSSIQSPIASSPSIPDLASTWSPPPVNPMSQTQSADQFQAPLTFTPEDIPTNTNSDSTISPLNNPWTTPPTYPQNQPQASPQPTWMPNNTTADTLDPVTANNNERDLAGSAVPENPEQPLTQPDPAPTDLSHLISNNSAEIGGQTVTPTAPETLIVPSQTNDPLPNLPTSPKENHKSIPMWLIGIGIGLFVIVAGASAYFILGVGQHQQPAVSIPAEVAKTTIKAPLPIATPTPTPSTATQSANFGQFQASAPPKASSAAEIIKQRQQQGL